MIRFQFYGIHTVLSQWKNSKNFSQIGNQYFIFQSQCHSPHQLQICHILVFHLSKVILSSRFCHLEIHNLAIAFQFRRFVNQGWYFLPFGIYNLTEVRLSSKDSLIKDAFLFFLVCIQKKPPEVFFVKKYSPKNTYFAEHLWTTASMYYHFTVALALFRR